MERLFDSLRAVRELLEQIHTITENQTTVLLGGSEDSLDMLEAMFEYKSNLMSELEEVETTFQGNYQRMKMQLEGRTELITLKKEVGNILELKEEIVVMEQSNLLIMQDRTKKHMAKIEVTPNAKQVTNAYKQQTTMK